MNACLDHRAKLAADRNLSKRNGFFWTILRPGHLSDEPGTGKIELGKTHMGSVSASAISTRSYGCPETIFLTV